jgi:hypothetical protein
VKENGNNEKTVKQNERQYREIKRDLGRHTHSRYGRSKENCVSKSRLHLRSVTIIRRWGREK